MAKITWKTPQDLGAVADNLYFEKNIIALGLQPIYFSLLNGNLPAGVELSDNGVLSGVPQASTVDNSKVDTVYTFTVRAVDGEYAISDKTFTILVAGIIPPVVAATSIDLGTFYDGTYLKLPLVVSNIDIESDVNYKLYSGRIPPGITLSSDGLLEGFFEQNIVPDFSPATLGWDNQFWDKTIFDYVQPQEDSSYNFVIEIFDGENFIKQNYVMKVIARDLLTIDRTKKSVDSTKLLVSASDLHLPYITTPAGFLPEIKSTLSRQDTYFAYKFEGVDYDNDDLYFEISSPDDQGFDQFADVGWDTDSFDSSNYPMPIGLGLDNHTGWYTGQIDQQTLYQKDYVIKVYCRKPNDYKLVGVKKNFTIRVLGSIQENITWITDADLGSIDNGLLSIIQVKATHTLNKQLHYKLKSDGSRIPQGLQIQSNGAIGGRVSFNYLQYDKDKTSFDQDRTNFDKLFRFTIIAYTEDYSSYSEKTFKLRINTVNKKPFENLYLKGFPSKQQRQLFQSVMSRQDIFPDHLIYRPSDPYYGKAKDLRFLFIPGVNPSQYELYIEALKKNHKLKSILFGDIKTATAYDDNFNIQYEVVYLEVIDEEESIDPVTGQPIAPKPIVDLRKNKNQFIDGSTTYYEYQSSALGNMRNRIIDKIGVANNNTLPAWMTSPQPNPNNSGQFLPPLGFTRGIVLAYTVPGGSGLIAYRLRNSGFRFNRILFQFDRYQLDNYLSANYNLQTKSFLPGVKTKVDAVPSVAQRFRELGTVDYVVSSAYLDIQNQTLAYVNGGKYIDNVDTVQEGETIIFSHNNQFPDNVPGYLDYIEKGIPNRRSAVYRIEIAQDNTISLKLLRLTKPGDIVSITKGTVYKGKKMVFEHYALHSQQPVWWYFNEQLQTYQGITDKLIAPHVETTFDKGATKFISNRDEFADLDTTGKYLRFPKNGVFI